MLKKLISYAICVCVMLGMIICSADAAAPIVYDKGETVIFEQNFGGLSGNTDSKLDSKLEITGDWHFQKGFIMEKGYGAVLTKAATDLSSAESVEFTAEAILTWNGIGMNLGTSAKGNTYNGYKVYLASDGMYLFKDGFKLTTDGKVDKANADASTTLSGGYGGFAKYIVNVSGNTITITIDGKDGSLVYTDESVEKIELNGLFGIEDMSTGGLAIFNMSLKAYDTVTVNDWRYEKVFSATDTVEQLAKDGLVFDKTQVEAFNSDHVQLAAASQWSFAPGGNVISGDYTTEIKVTKDWSSHNIKFNYIDASNYYEFGSASYGGDWNAGSSIWLRKVENGTVTQKLYSVEDESTVVSTVGADGFIYGKGATYVYNISVDETEDGKVNINASVSSARDGNTYTVKLPTSTDETPFAQKGCIRMEQNTGGSGRLYYFKAYSTPSGTAEEKNVTLIDKTITANDTIAGLANDHGIICEVEPTRITNDGLIWDTASAWPHLRCEKILSGDYTLTAVSMTPYNSYWYYINYIDDNNYYRLDIPKNGIITAKKKKNGTEIPLTVTQNDQLTSYNNSSREETAVIKLNHSNGALTINVTLNVYDAGPRDLTITDPSDTIDSGKFRVCLPFTGDGDRFKSLKVVSHNDPASSGISEGVFKINGTQTYSYAKGEIYFECPVAIIGDYSVVAALYEDNALTDVKVLRPVDIYGEAALLFDTTNSSAANGSVKVYFVDNTNSLNKLTDVWELK